MVGQSLLVIPINIYRVDIIPVSEQLCARAFQFFRVRPDKEWGMPDCLSFIVMLDRGLAEALTTDEHCQQAGFHALLRQQ
jgi:predicted nucleic acid-binding protein